jgi:protein-L-isoaspartate O-methyltransferase
MKQFDVEYFSRIYELSHDPWGFERSWYERRKYAMTLAALPRERYEAAFEPGCSFGVLSELLAPCCERLTCYELVPSVAMRARERLRKFSHVDVREAAIPAEWPESPVELVLLSEVLYYLPAAGIEAVASHIERTLQPGGHVVAVHYRKETDYPMSGDAAATTLMACLTNSVLLGTYLEPAFRIDVLERAP